MKKLFLILLFCLISSTSFAQLWYGVLDSNRATDWSVAGVTGGIPSGTWTQCGSTINAYTGSAATINNAIAACGTNQYVQLGTGTFTLSSGITITKDNVALRGNGANLTILNFTSSIQNLVLVSNGNSGAYFYDVDYTPIRPGGTQAATWSSGYTKGTKDIVLTGIGSNGLSVGKYIFLDQLADTAVNSGYFVCEAGGCSNEGGTTYSRYYGGTARSPAQGAKIESCNPSCTNGATFTLDREIVAPNIASGKSPGAFWMASMVQYVGVENLTILDNSGYDENTAKNLTFATSANCWVKGVKFVRSERYASVQIHTSTNITIQDCYFFGGVAGHSETYAMDSAAASHCLIQNNIFHQCVVPILIGSMSGSVYAYNYSINNAFDSGMSPIVGGHTIGVVYNLVEGNIGQKVGADTIHGNAVMNTVFRNYMLGTDTGWTSGVTNAMYSEGYARYWNYIGNVLGTPGYHNAYKTGSSTSIYALGVSGGSVPQDSLVYSTAMFWGNYDTVTAANRWCGNNGNTGWSTTCSSTSEVPTTASTYPNAVPSTEILPASFYKSSKPSWWPTAKAWPPIGPDVTGGNISNLNGKVYSIPAKDCYTNIMSGPADGTGNVLSFNADACYTNTSTTAIGSGVTVGGGVQLQ
jgi:hypothetical protein